jgi:hypothetical protein
LGRGNLHFFSCDFLCHDSFFILNIDSDRHGCRIAARLQPRDACRWITSRREGEYLGSCFLFGNWHCCVIGSDRVHPFEEEQDGAALWRWKWRRNSWTANLHSMSRFRTLWHHTSQIEWASHPYIRQDTTLALVAALRPIQVAQAPGKARRRKVCAAFAFQSPFSLLSLCSHC